MRAARVHEFAPIDTAEGVNVQVVDDVPQPTVKENTDQVLLRVLAAAVNPGDCKILAGDVSLFMTTKILPYTLGMDVCGVVEAVGDNCTQLKPGDRVIGCLDAITTGTMAEYVVCQEKFVTLAPTSMSPIEAASLPCAGATALEAIKKAKLPANSRVMVLGASGGVGSLLVQLLRNAGASFIAATSTNEKLVLSLGAHQVIDYRHAKWYEVLEGRNLDAIIDCVGCDDSWFHAHMALAKRGIFVAVSTNPESQLRSMGDFFGFAGPVLRRSFSPFTPRYAMVGSFPTGAILEPLVAQVNEGKVKAVLDPSSPYAFTTEDLRKAICLQASHRAKGKLVVEVAQSSSTVN